VRVLVLRQNVRDSPRWLLRTEPGENVAECSLILQLTLEGVDLVTRNVAGASNRDFSQVDLGWMELRRGGFRLRQIHQVSETYNERAPCPRHRNLPIPLCWFTDSG